MEITKVTAWSGKKFSLDYQGYNFGMSVSARLEAGEDFVEVMDEVQTIAREGVENAIEAEKANNPIFNRGLKKTFENTKRVGEQKEILEKRRKERGNGDD